MAFTGAGCVSSERDGNTIRRFGQGLGSEQRVAVKNACYTITVRFRDLDALGHVNYAVYLTYLEEAFSRFWAGILASAGKAMVPGDPGCITVRAEIDYRTPAQFGEIISVTVWVSAIGKSSFTAAYRITDQSTSRLIADAKTVQVVRLPGQEEKLIPPEIRQALDECARAGGSGPDSNV